MVLLAVFRIIFVTNLHQGYTLGNSIEGCNIQKITNADYQPIQAFLPKFNHNSTRNTYSETNRTVYLRGHRDARIAMLSIAEPSDEEFGMMYEIAIGAGNNTYSSIRKGKVGSLLDKNFTRTIGILDDEEWKGFWIYHNQETGTIQVALTDDPEYPIMCWVDPSPLRVSENWQVGAWLKNLSLEISVQCNPDVHGVYVEELTSCATTLKCFIYAIFLKVTAQLIL
ncbi:uncharacterized protein LOC136028282 [Artemia franciscana]|uniref:Farnesoic acid O-methyl transferase domain-containing protein n=1 Tax=Artemia franciscana TaxID=6661 RepID=A0AA88KV26_ARTSF|nr:hypothetical protein QYM36_013939 [Artemia franciscana]